LVDFINEVEEELRKDKYNLLLRKYGPYIVAIIFAIIGFAAYIEYKKNATSVMARRASASFVSAGKHEASGDLQAAGDKFVALSDVAPSGYAGLSLVKAAGLKVQLGDMDGAIALFDQAASAFELPRHKDLAAYRAIMILMDLGRYDDAQARLIPLVNGDGPYQDLAKELEAQALYKKGDIKAARAKLSYLVTAPGVLQGVKTRSSQMLSLLNAEYPVADPVEAPKPDDIPAPMPQAPEQPSPEEE